jgi:hypothetical protein
MFIAKQSKKFKIICVGGAVHMITGQELPISDRFDFPLLEALYRLRSDTIRRLARFLKTLFFVLIDIKNIKKKYEFKLLSDK